MRWIIPVLLLAALAAAWGGTAQAQANTRIILVPGGGGGNEVGWSASPAYGKLNDGRLPGKLFSDGIDRELDAVRGYTDSSELMLRYIGNVDALLPSGRRHLRRLRGPNIGRRQRTVSLRPGGHSDHLPGGPVNGAGHPDGRVSHGRLTWAAN